MIKYCTDQTEMLECLLFRNFLDGMGESFENGQIIHKYKVLGKAGEGTFSEVLKVSIRLIRSRYSFQKPIKKECN